MIAATEATGGAQLHVPLMLVAYARRPSETGRYRVFVTDRDGGNLQGLIAR